MKEHAYKGQEGTVTSPELERPRGMAHLQGQPKEQNLRERRSQPTAETPEADSLHLPITSASPGPALREARGKGPQKFPTDQFEGLS